MDFDKIENIKKFKEIVSELKKKDKYKKMTELEFSNEMKNIFPSFYKENRSVFNLITENKNLEILEMMFSKIEKIKKQYQKREKELIDIEPIINNLKEFLKTKEECSKYELIFYCNQLYHGFADRYKIIIERLADKDCRKLSAKELLLDEVKYKHEMEIGEKLAKQYIHKK